MDVQFSDHRSRRIDPKLSEVIHREHLDRYRMALERARGKRVLDIGCGFGYGSAILADVAASVHAVDMYHQAIDYAVLHYKKSNLHFAVGDGSKLAFEDCAFDIVVTFEVIEHVEDVSAFLAEVYRVLAPGGSAILSTPNGDLTLTPAGPSDPTHLREYRPGELSRVLSTARFDPVKLMGQELGEGVWKVHTLSAQASRMDFLKIRKIMPRFLVRWAMKALVFVRFGRSPSDVATTKMVDDVSRSHVLVAICKKPDCPPVPKDTSAS